MPTNPEDIRVQTVIEDEQMRERVRLQQRGHRARLELRIYAVIALIALVVLWAIGHSIRSH